MTADARPLEHACAHCGVVIEGGGSDWCCSGCEMASAIIRGAGLEQYYARRESPGPRPSPVALAWDSVAVEQAEDGGSRAALQVDGLTCAACVWVTERVLLATPGVREAMVSHATGRCRVSWDPATVDLRTIADRIAAIGYRPRPLNAEVAPDRTLLVRLGVAAFAAMNVMLLSASIYAGWLDGMDPAHAAMFRWATLALATPVALWCAEPLYVGAIAGLRAGVLHMDLPVSIGVGSMYAHGVYATLRGEDGWLDSLTMLVALLLAGRVLEQRGRRRAVEAATALANSAPRLARRGGVEIPASELQAGDRIDVGLGEEVPADGVVVAGAARVRMSILTGEAEPVAVAVGERVVAGAVVEDGALAICVQAVGGQTLLARMADELAQAADRPAPPTLTDRIAPWFTGATLALAGLALALGGPERAMAVLVVACPCALALASPLATAAGLGAAARRGLLVRTGEALRALAEVRTVAFDKTGTITHGEPAVVAADDAVLRVAAGLERSSGHPVARAIRNEAIRRGIALPEAHEVREVAGVGISGTVDGRRWTLGAGRPGQVEIPGLGAITLQDVPRHDAARTVSQLRALGYRVVLVSGDHLDVARRIADAAGIEEVVAGASPEQKAAWVRAQGGEVLFVGDGVNDGPALAASSVGVAMGQGAASSVLVADAIVAQDGLGPVVAGLRAAVASKRAVRGNATRSLVYNAGAVAAALLGLVNPLVAAVLMPLSSSLVVWGASRVERWTR